jgi:mono/diheme cytochrome c family protein
MKMKEYVNAHRVAGKAPHLKVLSPMVIAWILCFGCGTQDDQTQFTEGRSDAAMEQTVDRGTNMSVRDAAIIVDAEPLIVPIPKSEQRPGDPVLGYQVLVNEPYVSCGVPSRIFDQFFGSAAPQAKLRNRNALNRDRRYFETAFVSSNGVEVVGTNCLQCHAEYLDGEVYVGLGDTTFDYTRDTSTAAEALKVLVQDNPDEKVLVDKWAQRVQTIAPFVRTKTIGVNPADSLTEVLLAHRDRNTLAWSQTPLLELEEPYAIPISVPPWWFMKKKHAMFYTGSGRGDHARFMMSASTLCTDSVEEAAAIDAQFPHVRAFISSIEAPTYPRAVNAENAALGQALFNTTCASCHGTYGEDETYPNVLVNVSYLGTDPLLSESAFNAKLDFFDWYNESFYGELAHAVPTAGYIAPPLDGVWATAPYLHNGSVPTLLGVISPDLRPTFWSRDYSDYIIDEDAGGLIYIPEALGHQDILSAARRGQVYDTTLKGYSNAGHNFGAHLSDEEARQIVEYLKTL